MKEIIYVYNMESILLYCNAACFTATIQLNQKTKQKLIYKNLIILVYFSDTRCEDPDLNQH